MHVSRRQLGLGLLALAPLGFGGEARSESLADLPNVFISPCGKPFRAKTGAPYPVVDWFGQADADHDGKLTRKEFVDDAAAFFKHLDANGDGYLSPTEVAFYEHNIAPEILGVRVVVDARAGPPARLWLAQYGGSGGYGEGPDGMGGDSSRLGSVTSHEELTPSPRGPKTLDELGQGASPYSFFDEPEPVMAADLDFNGLISRANFLKVADTHFSTLDRGGRGWLTLAGLPRTPIEKRIDQILAKRR